MNLKSILTSITPENLRKIPFVGISLDIFVDCINRNNEICQRITSLFEVTEYENDSEMLKRSKDILKEGLYYTWIYTLYNALKKLSENPDIKKDLEKYNYTDSVLLQGINHIINPEFLSTNHTYNQKIGTEQAMRYIYYFGKYLETGDYSNDLEVIDKNPFVLFYEGSMGKRMFRGTVKPLAHPIGWIDTYVQIISLIFHDYYGIEIFKTYTKIELQNKEKWVVFIFNSDIDGLYLDFKKRINPLTNRPYSTKDIDENVSVITNKIVSTYDQKLNEDGSIDKIIVFEDRTVLYHFASSPKKTIFTTYDDYLNGFLEPIKQWDENWIFYGDLTSNYRFLYYDNINEFEKIFHITDIKENNGGKTDLTQYIDEYQDNCFKIGGEAYPFLNGIDESRFLCNNFNEIKEQYKKFDTSIFYKVNRECNIIVEDYFKNRKLFKVKAGQGNLIFNTCDLQGFYYKVFINEIAGVNYYFLASGLNKFNNKCKFNNIFTENHILRIDFTVELDAGCNASLIIRDLKNFKTQFSFNQSGDYQRTFNIENFDRGIYTLELYVKNNKKVILDKAFFQGIDLKEYSDIEPFVSLIQYADKPTFIIDKTELYSVDQMKGFYSSAPYITYRIGQRYDGSFTKPYEKIEDYLDPNYNIWNNPNLTNKILRGAFIEGEDYAKSFWWHKTNDEMFINYGFKHFNISTSDFIITDSKKFVNDSLSFDFIGSGYYLYTDADVSESNMGRYLYTKDNQYLVSNENNIRLYLEQQNGIHNKYKFIEKNTKWKFAKEIIPIPELIDHIFIHWSLEDEGTPIDDDYVFTEDTIIYAVYKDLTKLITISFFKEKIDCTVNTVTLKNIMAQTNNLSLDYELVKNRKELKDLDLKCIVNAENNIDLFGVIHTILLFNISTKWRDIDQRAPDVYKEDYIFKYWSLDGINPISLDHVFTEDTNLYPVYEKIPVDINIYFNIDNTKPLKILKGTSFNEIKSFLYTPYKDNDKFLYWSTNNVNEIPDNYVFEKSTLLYAVFENDNSFKTLKLIISTKNQDYPMVIDVNDSYWKNIKGSLKIPKDKDFICWSLTKNGEPISDNYKFKKDTILYAVYKEK